MRVEFITEEDFYVLPLFEEFFRNFGAEFEIVRVSCCRPMGNRPRTQLLRELSWLYGAPGLTRLLGRYALARVLSRVPKRRHASRFYSLKQLCAAYNVPYAAIGSPNTDVYADELRARSADLLISVACPFILKRRILQAPPMGCINLHNAPLPRYKGMMPTFWQLFHGESSVGLTVHYMTEKIDDGMILFQDRLEVEPGETLDRLIRRSKRRAAHSLGRVLRELETGTANPKPMEKENGTYFSFPNRQQIREFHNRGLRAI